MSKVVEKNVAEIIVLTVLTIILMSSCGTGNYIPCPAYGNVEMSQEQYHAQLECENCDEIN
tara:strand:+ start:563 stop:745 length:183 start_codon:yes stop_codon:yes gene_type:complete